MPNSSKHENYELLNLLGYGLAKFDKALVHQFGFKTKTGFYNYFVELGVAKTTGVVSNRMDLFDPYFPNSRRGWWQKKDAYVHRVELINSLYGEADVEEFASIIKMILIENHGANLKIEKVKPITHTKYRRMQETGLEAELYFMSNYLSIEDFKNGQLEDARLFGDGYDFQITNGKSAYLAEVKGIRDNKGKFRMTETEYLKALEYQHDYFITLVMNMAGKPRMLTVCNPVSELDFIKHERPVQNVIEYHLTKEIS